MLEGIGFMVEMPQQWRVWIKAQKAEAPALTEKDHVREHRSDERRQGRDLSTAGVGGGRILASACFSIDEGREGPCLSFLQHGAGGGGG